MAYHNYHNVDIRIVRIFNTYGPRMRTNDGRALPTFFTQAISNSDITVFGDGSQTRSFCYVDDLIDGVYKLLMSDYRLPVNIGNPNEISILHLAHEVIELVQSNARIVFKGLPIDEPKLRRPDIGRAHKVLDWYPLIEREEGLIRTYDYFKSVMMV